jgi:hypothetical protein
MPRDKQLGSQLDAAQQSRIIAQTPLNAWNVILWVVLPAAGPPEIMTLVTIGIPGSPYIR